MVFIELIKENKLIANKLWLIFKKWSFRKLPIAVPEASYLGEGSVVVV